MVYVWLVQSRDFPFTENFKWKPFGPQETSTSLANRYSLNGAPSPGKLDIITSTCSGIAPQDVPPSAGPITLNIDSLVQVKVLIQLGVVVSQSIYLRHVAVDIIDVMLQDVLQIKPV